MSARRARGAAIVAAIIAVIVASTAGAPAASAGPGAPVAVADLCEHLPHLELCAGVTPAPGGARDVAMTMATAVKLGAIEAPAAVDATERIYALELDASATFGRWSAIALNLQIGGGSDGGTWLRSEFGYGLGRTWPNAALAAWGLAGFDVLTERLGFSLVVGGAARAAVRLPRLTLEVVGDYRFRNFDDLMDPTAPGPNRWVPRLRLAALVGHRVTDFSDPTYYGTRVAVEAEQWEGTRVYWLSFGTAFVLGPLPR
ncbi:MAG: hypothetical protein IPH44_09840 [Myxococcales bacterium]|nr:hypothetical protein [Myxococcales bacterium]MBK7198848.1 hypothetical protein [Myxococcales bacterium]MBP6845836.1 hypothetical protein [Kofleriaceae bacterium]